MQKIDLDKRNSFGTLDWLEHWNEPSAAKLVESKINEVVDAVNKHEDIIRQIGEWGTSKGECLWCENITAVNLNDRMIGCTTLEIPESYKTDPYAEQRKWIGKLCWFWDIQEQYKSVGILGEVSDNGTYFQKDGIVSYLNCEPVKSDSDIIYKGE